MESDFLLGGGGFEILGGLNSDEQFVPIEMFAGGSCPSAREGLIEQVEVSNFIHLHQKPVGKRLTTDAVNLVAQQLNRLIQNSMIVRFESAIFAVVDQPNQALLLDR